ncbi:O-antigen/teichoic acid export membrane protein [Rhodobacter sp. 140A]|nr:O-antigen/teichoic acid export membrane protein [Rhodobacter sp. 140A]
MVVKLAAAGLSYAMFVVLSRWLGADTYGRFASAFSAGTFLSFVMLLGLHTELLRGLPQREAAAMGGGETRWAFLWGTSRALGLSILVFGTLGVVLAVATTAIGRPQWAGMIVMAIAIAGGLALAEFLASMFRALGAVSIALLPRDVLWRGLVLGSVLVLALLHVEGGFVSAAALTVVLLLLTLGLQFFWGRSLLPAKDTSPQAIPPVRGLLWDARWLAAAALASNLLQPLAVVAVGAVLSYADSGVFFAAQKTAALLSLPLIAMNMIGAPQIARAWSAGDRAEVQRICTHVAVTATAGTAVGLAVVLGFSGDLLGVFNPAYRDQGAILIVLSLGNILNTLAGPTGYLMLMTGHEKRFVLISSVAQVSGILTVVIGGALFGLAGAAWGEVVGVAIFNVAIWRWGRKRLGVDSSFFSLARKQN